MSRWHLYRQYLSWQLFSISWIVQLFLTQFWTNFLGALIFSDQNCFWPKIFLDPTFFGLKKFWPNFFEQKMFLTLNCFKTNSKMTSHQPNLVLHCKKIRNFRKNFPQYIKDQSLRLTGNFNPLYEREGSLNWKGFTRASLVSKGKFQSRGLFYYRGSFPRQK